MAKKNISEHEQNILRLERRVILPSIFASLILFLLTLQLKSAAGIYLAMNLFTLTVMRIPAVRKRAVGINKRNLGVNILFGILFFLVFIIINAFAPFFALALPPAFLSLGKGINAFVIIGLAAFSEEAWRDATIAVIKTFYNVSFAVVNIVQAAVFSLIHFLAIGIFLEVIEKFSALVGQVNAQAGFLSAAFLFSLISGWLMMKTNGSMTSSIGHSGFNAFLFFKKTSKFVVAS